MILQTKRKYYNYSSCFTVKLSNYINLHFFSLILFLNMPQSGIIVHFMVGYVYNLVLGKICFNTLIADFVLFKFFPYQPQYHSCKDRPISFLISTTLLKVENTVDITIKNNIIDATTMVRII